MKFFAAPLLIVAALASSVLAQAAGNDFVDDVFTREDGFYDLHARHSDEIFEMKREVERLERRSRSVCYAACATLTGQNKGNCWKKCDAIWGK